MATEWSDDDVTTYESLKGAKVVSVTAPSSDTVRIGMEDGRALRLWLDGDCCSSSYYSDPHQFEELIGATIQSIEERDGESREGLDDERKTKEEYSEDDDVSWHFLVFVTDKGHVTIDWRNDSNGYYDGSVHPAIEPAAPLEPSPEKQSPPAPQVLGKEGE